MRVAGASSTSGTSTSTVTPSTVAWFDPGRTTGIALWDSRTNIFTSIQTGSLLATGRWVEMLLLTNDEDPLFQLAIGWERYIITPGNTRHGTAYWSIETIGMLRFLALNHEITILDPQVSSMMTAIPDDRLKAIGWYSPGKPHANDAARHLARYMLKAGILPADLKAKAFPVEDTELEPCEYDDETF